MHLTTLKLVKTWRITNFRLHFCTIFKNVSQAISWKNKLNFGAIIQWYYENTDLPQIQTLTCTPGCVSCINSNSLLTTVLRNFQWALKNLGYWPTTYLTKKKVSVYSTKCSSKMFGNLHLKQKQISINSTRVINRLCTAHSELFYLLAIKHSLHINATIRKKNITKIINTDSLYYRMDTVINFKNGHCSATCLLFPWFPWIVWISLASKLKFLHMNDMS
jgi:hypothetical protein